MVKNYLVFKISVLFTWGWFFLLKYIYKIMPNDFFPNIIISFVICLCKGLSLNNFMVFLCKPLISKYVNVSLWWKTRLQTSWFIFLLPRDHEYLKTQCRDLDGIARNHLGSEPPSK